MYICIKTLQKSHFDNYDTKEYQSEYFCEY